MLDINSPVYRDKNAARKHVEAMRWADGRYCPHCGETENTSFVRGKKHRPGLYYCNACKAQFTVTVGTIFERSKVPLNKWVLAFHLMCSSKKGVSAHQLHRTLGVTYKTAWFMAHRIRESMKEVNPGPLGGGGKVVEADETFFKGGGTTTIETLPNGRKVPVVLHVMRRVKSRYSNSAAKTRTNRTATIARPVKQILISECAAIRRL